MSVSMVVTNYDLEDDDIYRNRVYELAKCHEISVYKSYREILNYIEKGDIAFSVAYGNEIFKADILDKIEIYNFHPSYLPYYKGPAPIQWQIKNRESEWGMTCHEVDSGIDTGRIIKRDTYRIDQHRSYQSLLDEYNNCFADFIVENIVDITEKTEFGEKIETIANSNLREDYKPHLLVPRDMWDSAACEISDYLNRIRVLFFAGNRAELGIMFPVILEMSKYYFVDLLVADTYYISGLQDLEEKKKFVEKNKYNVNFIEIAIRKNEDIYFESFPSIYKQVFSYVKKQEQYQYKFAVVLGDRIESLGFALAVFYGKIPLVHMAGGDIANVPYFDTNVRHCISKLASLHFPFNQESAMVLRQLGEEERRICVIGSPTFDYNRMQLLLSKNEIEEEFQIGNKFCAIFTYHSGPLKTATENLKEYQECLQGVLDSDLGKIIVTYPNHDPGSEKVLQYVSELEDTDRIIIVKSLGSIKLHSIMKNFNTIIVGNSSMGLSETTYYMCPAINIGDRQISRIRGGNVTDVNVKKKSITDVINLLIKEFASNRILYRKDKTMFGDGNAADKAINFLKIYEKVPTEELITKKFETRMLKDYESDGDFTTP